MSISRLGLYILVLFVSGPIFASEKFQIKSMSEVSVQVEELRKQFKPEEILVVFDIDNTLMTTEKDLGGDAWFAWQEEKIKNNDSFERVAPDFQGLLKIQGFLFSLGQMNPPETMTPGLVQKLQQQGHPLFLLTSRGSEFLNYTQRELTRNGYDPSLTAPGPDGGFAGRFLPYNPEKPEQSCLKQSEVTAWGLKNPQPSLYTEGVFYTSGQHKGAMLRTLLCKTRKSYAAIVFVDDLEKHVDRVLLAYESYNTEVRSLRYGAVDEQVERFKASDKKEVVEGWAILKNAFEKVFDRPF